MSGTKSFPADNVKLHIASAADAPTGTMTVLMRTNRYYTDGSLLQTGEEYTVTKEWGQDALSRNWCEDVADVFPETETPSGLTAAQVAATQALVPGDGINIHPNLWCDLTAANLVSDDPQVLDGSGAGRHAVRGIALPVADLHAEPGYFSTLKGTGSAQATLDTALHMPSINFDYDGGEALLVVVTFKAPVPAADESMLGNAGSSSANGFRLRLRSGVGAGYCDFGMYSTTGAVASLSGIGLTVLVDDTPHQYAVLMNGQTKNRSMWEDGVLTRPNFGALASCDTRESAGLHLGATQINPSSAANTAAINFRRVTIFRWGPTDTVPELAAITTVVQRLRNNITRLPLQGDF